MLTACSYRAAPAGLGIILMQTGLPTLTVWPVGLSVPSWGSMRKTTIVSESWFSARRRDPVGSIAKLRGFLPWVVAAVRAVEELAGGVDLDLGGVALPAEAGGQRRDRLDRGKSPAVRVVGEGGHGVGHLVDDVGEPAFGMEGEMPRSGGGRDLGERRLVRGEPPARRVERVDQHLVEPEVGHECEAVRRVEVDRVRVRAFLSPGVGAPATMLDRRRGRAEPAVPLDRQAAHAAAAVVRHQHVLALPVDDQVARARAGRQLLVQRGQRPLALVDREGADAAVLPAPDPAHLVDRVEELAVGMDRQERRIGRGGRQPGRVQRTRADVELHQVDPPAALAPPAVGISADVDPVHPGRTGRGLGLRPRDARRGQQHHRDQGHHEARREPDPRFRNAHRTTPDLGPARIPDPPH
jgi:hypothetical protein